MRWSSTILDSALAGGVSGNVTSMGEAAWIVRIVKESETIDVIRERGDSAGAIAERDKEVGDQVTLERYVSRTAERSFDLDTT